MNNPYWDEVQKFPPDEIARKYDHRWEPQWTSVPWDAYPMLTEKQRHEIKHRDDLCMRYAWSIPDPHSLAFVAAHLGKSALIIGACIAMMQHLKRRKRP